MAQLNTLNHPVPLRSPSPALRIEVRHDISKHREVEINNKLFIEKKLYTDLLERNVKDKANLGDLLQENRLLRSWIDFFLGIGPKPLEALS